MNELRKAAEMALEALKASNTLVDSDEAITALRQALEQPAQSTADKCKLETVPAKGGLLPAQPPQQEPVVWMYQDKSTHEVKFQKHMRGFVDHGATYETPLYTAPPKREWIGLTEKEIDTVMRQALGYGLSPSRDDLDFARAIEAKLKEKNT